MKLSKDSITVNMVVKLEHKNEELNLNHVQEIIESGNFTAEFIPASTTTCSTGTLIICEKSE